MNNATYQCTVTFCAALIAMNTCADDLGSQWVERNPYPTGQTIHSLIYANNMFAAVSSNDGIFTSETGAEWTPRYPGIQRFIPSRQRFLAIAYGEGQFVAVGEWGILVSVDGTQWTGTSGVSDLKGIAYGGGRFVAIGSNSVVVLEDDLSWSETPLIRPGSVIAYVDGKFISNLDGMVAISTNGVDWIDTSLAGDFSGFSAGSGRIVAVGKIRLLDGSYSGIIGTSLDGGMTWARGDTGTPMPNLENVTFGGGVFVTVGERGTISTSNDGITWTNRNSGSLAHLMCVAYGQGNFVAVGTEGTVLTSADGISWTTRSYGTRRESFSDVTFGNGLFVALSSLDPCYYDADGIHYVREDISIRTSPDGINWIVHDPGVTNPLHRIIAAPGIFVTVGDGGTILTSSNGFAWTRQNSGTTNALSGITYGDGKFVAVGDRDILSSTDGIIWRLRATGTNPLYSVAYGSGMFVAVGGYQSHRPNVLNYHHSAIVSSIDGENWVKSDTNYGLTASSIVFGGGRFVVVGRKFYPTYTGVGLTSTDGVAWTGIEVGGTSSDIDEAVTYGDGTFVAVGWYGRIDTSLDGISWTARHQPSSVHFRGIAYGNRTFIAVGRGGSILQSGVMRAPWLSSPTWVSNQGLRFSVSGEVGQAYRVQASPDMSQWTDVAGFTNSAPTMEFVDPASMGLAQRFYRVLSQ